MKELEPRQQSPNRLGGFSLGLGIAAFIVAVATMAILFNVETKRAPDKQYQPGDATVVSDSLHNGVSSLVQFLVFGVGFLVGGTLSLAGLIAGSLSVSHENRTAAVWGIGLSVASPLALYVFLRIMAIL